LRAAAWLSWWLFLSPTFSSRVWLVFSPFDLLHSLNPVGSSNVASGQVKFLWLMETKAKSAAKQSAAA
jgi:hypothetical protein